jgi:cell division GTPase FtsZ
VTTAQIWKHFFWFTKKSIERSKVIGVGGGGSAWVNHMFKQEYGVDFVCNTDSQKHYKTVRYQIKFN